MSALNGDLRDFGIAEVFQLIGQQSKTGMLEIQDSSRTIRLSYDAGSVVSATPAGASEYAGLGDRLVRCGLLTRERMTELLQESASSARSLPSLAEATGAVSAADLREIRELLTRDTIFEVLRWTRGSFRFIAQPISNDGAGGPVLGAEQILMDGLRMVDEWQTFAGQVPSGDAVFERVGRFEVYRQQATGDSRHRLVQAELIFELIDGRLSTRRVIDLSRLGIFDATRILSDLRSGGCIEPLWAALAKKAGPRGQAAPLTSRLGSWAATAVPLALLFGVVTMLFLQQAPRGERLSIERGAFEAARLEFQKRRLRNAVEAERFLHGEWPEDLAGAARSGLVDAASLAQSSRDAYYYARHADELLLLAPER